MDDSSSGYRFDAFLSYSRGGHWETFVQEFFEPILTHWLGEELGRTPVIFRDRTALSIGQNWPAILSDSLHGSRVMIMVTTVLLKRMVPPRTRFHAGSS